MTVYYGRKQKINTYVSDSVISYDFFNLIYSCKLANSKNECREH